MSESNTNSRKLNMFRRIRFVAFGHALVWASAFGGNSGDGQADLVLDANDLSLLQQSLQFQEVAFQDARDTQANTQTDNSKLEKRLEQVESKSEIVDEQLEERDHETMAQTKARTVPAASAPPCSTTDLMCPLMDNTGCPNSCATNVALDDVFIGGTSTCPTQICTCDISSSINRIGQPIRNLSNSGQQVTDGSIDAWECARLCAANHECNFAFFRRWQGECRLLRACDQRVTTWVGSTQHRQGGITFQKYQRPLAVATNGWPSRYFGDFAGLNYSEMTQNAPEPTFDDWTALSVGTPTFSGSSGVADGYDWSLPTTALASPMGKVANVRLFGLSDYWFRMLQNAPVLPGVQQVVEFWVKWRDLETADNQFNFTTFDTFLAEAARKGFSVYVRLMSSDKRRAPAYFQSNTTLSALIGDALPASVPHSRGVRCPSDRGQPWNIESDEFHRRYLRLVQRMQPYCQRDVVAAMFVGWMSCSNGDEGIGPSNHGYDGHDGHVEPEIVRERLQQWNVTCPAHKVVMAGKSTYGRSMGFGLREGFVEMYWYREPGTSHASYEGHTLASTGHIEIDETNVLANGQATNADENEEYPPAWSSEWRCSRCASLSGDKGNDWDGAAAAAGSQSRFGSIRSFPYRYMLSSLRALHLRSTMLILSPDAVVNPSLSRYVALSLGHNSSSTSDAWCFLIQGDTQSGRVINWERWLTQRDSTDPSVNGGQPSAPEARFPTTPINASMKPNNKARGTTEFVARAATELAFAVGAAFQGRVQQAAQAWVKVSFFDVGEARSIALLRGAVGASGVRSCNSNQSLGRVDLNATPSDRVLTATFPISSPADLTAFCVAGRNSADARREIVVSFVRVII